MAKRARVTRIRPAGPGHQVVTTERKGGGAYPYRREPCAQCPWRRDSPVGEFPAEAYRHSAGTCHDAAFSTFACHMSGKDQPATCAGFLLSRHAEHNIQLRLRMMTGAYDPDTVSSPVPLYDDYREMAQVNGVPADDPALRKVRSDKR